MKNSALDQVKDLVASRQGRTDHKLRWERQGSATDPRNTPCSTIPRRSQRVAECARVKFCAHLRRTVARHIVSRTNTRAYTCTNRSSACGRSIVRSAWRDSAAGKGSTRARDSSRSRDIIGYVCGISSEFHSRSDPVLCTSPSLRRAKRRIPPSRIHHADRGIGPTWVVPVLRKQSARRADASLCSTIRYSRATRYSGNLLTFRISGVRDTIARDRILNS